MVFAKDYLPVPIIYFDLENLVLWARSELTGSARRNGAKV
jgi:hypothetical protein